ncbi:CCB3 [Symbiodinium natans]|uniref:CCB3 protein n=1 Tax=Symbiodinium natans TaxID=878477 RepID=A0A812R8M2_9DINO|nr:CCB3 [Symbiodinium natans]
MGAARGACTCPGRSQRPGDGGLCRRQAARSARSGTLSALCALFVLAAAAGSAFVPGHVGHGCSRQPLGVTTRHAQEGKKSTKSRSEDYDQYDWQRVSGSSRNAQEVLPDLADLPDLPDFGEEEEEDSSAEGEVKAQVKVREVLPDLPGIDDDLLPPGPNPWSDGGLGFLEWTGIWAGLLTVVLAVGAGGSWIIARLQLEPEVAGQLLDFLKPLLNVYQLLFLARVLLAQFPKLDTTEWPYAIVHYPTEFVLGPTRMILKPEAGVDVSPFVWLLFTSLVAELLTGSFGILQMVKDSSRSRLGDSVMSIR